MADLIFGCTGASADRYAVTPTLSFQLAITERSGVRVHAIALRCQIRIEPHRRRYTATEAERLHDLFGDTSRWADTVKPIQLATVTVMPGGAVTAKPTEQSEDAHAGAARVRRPPDTDCVTVGGPPS